MEGKNRRHYLFSWLNKHVDNIKLASGFVEGQSIFESIIIWTPMLCNLKPSSPCSAVRRRTEAVPFNQNLFEDSVRQRLITSDSSGSPAESYPEGPGWVAAPLTIDPRSGPRGRYIVYAWIKKQRSYPISRHFAPWRLELKLLLRPSGCPGPPRRPQSSGGDKISIGVRETRKDLPWHPL